MDDISEDITPIFILGVDHSGTSIFYKMLAFHPQLAWFSQYSQRDGVVAGRFRLPLGAYINPMLRPFLKHSWRKETAWWDVVRPRPSEAHKIWEHLVPRWRQGRD